MKNLIRKEYFNSSTNAFKLINYFTDRVSQSHEAGENKLSHGNDT